MSPRHFFNLLLRHHSTHLPAILLGGGGEEIFQPIWADSTEPFIAFFAELSHLNRHISSYAETRQMWPFVLCQEHSTDIIYQGSLHWHPIKIDKTMRTHHFLWIFLGYRMFLLFLLINDYIT
jgi:hypothetical protein